MYSFGHLKSAKSFENGGLRRETCQNGNSENIAVGRLRRAKCQKKNAHSLNFRAGRLCIETSKGLTSKNGMVEFTNFAEKNTKEF